MLEKPDLDDNKVINCLKRAYGLEIAAITFLPLGADLNTAVYTATTPDNKTYFVKLRRGDFDEAAVAVPKYLSDHGLKQIIPSLTTQTGQLYAHMPPFKVILYPFVEGRDGYERPLSEPQWAEFGSALKQFHTAELSLLPQSPTALKRKHSRHAGAIPSKYSWRALSMRLLRNLSL